MLCSFAMWTKSNTRRDALMASIGRVLVHRSGAAKDVTCLGQRDRAYWILSRAALLRSTSAAKRRRKTANRDREAASPPSLSMLRRQTDKVARFAGSWACGE